MNLRRSFLIIFFLAWPAFVNAQDSIKEADQLDFAQGLLSRGMYDMAILQYQKFIANYPHSSSLEEAYLALGEGYFLSQDFQKASDIFSQFIQLYPHSDKLPVSLLRLGQIDIQQKKYDDALKELTSMDVQNQLKGPMLQSFDYYTAQAYSGKADDTSAMAFYQKATQVDGTSAYTAYAFEGIGQIQSQSKKYTESIDAYTKALQVAQDDSLKAEISYKTAEVEFLAGDYADAIKAFQQVIDLYPSYGFTQDALANLLLGYFNLGQYDQLLGVYKNYAKELKSDETYFKIHIAAVLAYIELKEYAEANALLDHVLAFPTLKPQERAKIFVEKADILIREGKYKDGMALLDAYSSQDIDDADESSFLKAQGYFGLGNYDQAFSAYENVNLNFPDSRFLKAALLGEAHTRQKMGRFKESQILFLKYYNIQDDPGLKGDALYDALMMAVKAGDLSGTISTAQEYLKEFPNGEEYSRVLIILADNYGSNNQPQDAVNLLQGYLGSSQAAQRPNSANFLLGFYQQSLGNSDQALAAYSEVDPQKEDGKFYAAALKNSAIIYLGQKKEDQARIYFDRLISQVGPNDLQLKTYIWVCNEYIKLQKFNDALRVATQAEKIFPLQNLIEIKYFKAEALRGLGSCDEAEKDYAAVLSSSEKNMYTGSSHIGYGLCLENANKFDEAKAEFQKSLDENADDYTITVHARFEMANLYDSQGDYDDALKFYLLVATIYDDDYFCSESLLRAAHILEHMKRPEEASKLYSEILDKYPKSLAAESAKDKAGLSK